jgi:hypothetical protein
VLENYVGLSRTTVHTILKKKSTFYSQQDGAPTHYVNTVTEFLDEIFPRRWIEKGGWKQWPTRSPDLTLLDIYFSWHVKPIVYSVHIHNIQHLKQRIRETVASVTPDVLGRVWQEMEYRLHACRATCGAHTELR